MKNLKIRTKLALLGIILLLSFSAVIYTVNADNDRIHDLNDSARVSYSTRALSTKWRIARQELVNAYFVAAMANETGALSAEMRAAIGERAVDLDDVFERLTGKGADRLVTASVWAGAQTNGKRLVALVRDEFPALAEQRVGREGVGDLSGRIMAESEKLAEAQTVVDDALKEQFGTLAQTVNDELASANTRLMLIATPMAVLMLAAMVVIALGITRPLRATVMDIRKLADGDLEQKLAGLTRRDEIGDVVQALLDLQAATARRADAAMEHDRQAQAAMEAEKQATMRDFAEGFEASVGNIVETVISGARKARESSEKVRTMSDETTERSAAVAASAEESSVNVQTVAAAADQLARSINTVAQHVNDSSAVAKRAVEEIQRTNATMSELSMAAQKIGDVVQLIARIAGQTNLLALNATIEAARAGEAGRGFAVVASEVKDLAQQTARATQEIEAQVGAVQQLTTDALVTIEGISSTITEIDSASVLVASAIVEQTSATEEIANNVKEVSNGTADVTSNITNVTTMAHTTRGAVHDLMEAAGATTEQAEQLRQEVHVFLSRVRAA